MNQTSSLQAVLFDLDGVITDTAEYHYLAWNAIAEELGIPFSREFNENLKGVSRMDSLKLLLSQAPTPPSYTADELEQLADRKNKLYQELIDKVTPADLLPGIADFIADIKRHGVKMGLASASKNALAVISRLGIADQFDVIVDAAALKNNKPDPEIFLTGAAALNADPKFCIGVEDAVAGVDAIKAAGMFAVAIGSPAAFPHADLVLESTAQLRFQELANRFS